MNDVSQIAAWRALLALPAPDQQTFVQSATAFMAARGIIPDPDRGAAPAAAPVPIPEPFHPAPTLARRQLQRDKQDENSASIRMREAWGW